MKLYFVKEDVSCSGYRKSSLGFKRNDKKRKIIRTTQGDRME
jgi:hypothetical protein